MRLYGIPNCETARKARVWLDSRAIAYDFHDCKKQGVDRAALEKWVAGHGWEVVLNGAGMGCNPEAYKAAFGAKR
jgi:arsenate reductase